MVRLGHGVSRLAHQGKVRGNRLTDEPFHFRLCLPYGHAAGQVGSRRTPFSFLAYLVDDQVLSHRSSSISALRLMLASWPIGMVALRLPDTVITGD
jgi:hypothetical protein